MDVLLQQLAGQPVPALITLPSKLVVRQSCGCASQALALASFLPFDESEKVHGSGSLEEARAGCVSEMEAALALHSEAAREWLESIFDAFMQITSKTPAARLKGSSENFLQVLNNVLEQALHLDQDRVHWQNVISILRRWMLALLADSETVEISISQARVVVEESVQRAQAYAQWSADREAEHLRETNRALLTTFDVKQLTDVLSERLSALGIPSVYLVVYEQPTDAEVPDHACLVLATSDHGRIPLEQEGFRFSTSQVIPQNFLPQGRRYSLVVAPLYFQDKSLGYVVFEIGPQDGNIYELLRNNLSSALQGAMLFQEIQQARFDAEKADRIKTRLLANVSHEMRTPLNIIMDYTQEALQDPQKYGSEIPAGLRNDLHQIQSNAEHQLRCDQRSAATSRVQRLTSLIYLLNCSTRISCW